jgi:hypothetical protein
MNDVVWQQCVNAVTDQLVQELATWRGYSIEFCARLREQKLIGQHKGCWAIPVHNREGQVVSCQCRRADGAWFYDPPTPTELLVIGPSPMPDVIFLFESPWDSFAYIQVMGWPDNRNLVSAVCATRGAGNGRLVVDRFPANAEIFAFAQNDKPDKRGKVAGEVWLQGVAEHSKCPVLRVSIPLEHKDLNDWLKAGASRKDIETAIE